MAALLKLTGLSWRELIRAIWRGSVETNVTNRAAELAFWFLLGFFPMLLSVTGMVSMIGSAPGSQGTLMTYVGEVLPSGASSLVRQVLAQTTTAEVTSSRKIVNRCSGTPFHNPLGCLPDRMYASICSSVLPLVSGTSR